MSSSIISKISKNGYIAPSEYALRAQLVLTIHLIVRWKRSFYQITYQLLVVTLHFQSVTAVDNLVIESKKNNESICMLVVTLHFQSVTAVDNLVIESKKNNESICMLVVTLHFQSVTA
jgi:hypothetical protein